MERGRLGRQCHGRRTTSAPDASSFSKATQDDTPWPFTMAGEREKTKTVVVSGSTYRYSKTRIWSGDAVSFPLLTMREPHPIYQPLILNLGHDRRADVAGFLVSSGEKTTSSPGHTYRILRTKKKRSEGKLSDFVCLLLIVTKTEARGTGQIVLNPLALAVDTNSSPFTWSRNCV